MQKIISAVVGPMPRPKPEGLFDDMPKVTVTFEDLTTKTLFSFYPDEIMFHHQEFMGLTVSEAYDLFAKKDTAYIRRFYPDEIMFHHQEFMGLTVSEAYDLFAKKDTAYIRR